MKPGHVRNIVALGLSALLFASAALAVVPAHCLRAWLAPASGGTDMAEAHPESGPHNVHAVHGATHMAHVNAAADLASSHLTEHPTPQSSPHSGSEPCVDCSAIVLLCCDATKALRSEALVITRDDELTRIYTVAVSTLTRHAVDIRPPISASPLARTLHAATHHLSSPSLLGVFLI